MIPKSHRFSAFLLLCSAIRITGKICDPFVSSACYGSVITAPGCLTTVTVRVENVPPDQLQLAQIDSKPVGATLSYQAAAPDVLQPLSASNFENFTIDVLVILEWLPTLVNAGQKMSNLLFQSLRNSTILSAGRNYSSYL